MGASCWQIHYNVLSDDWSSTNQSFRRSSSMELGVCIYIATSVSAKESDDAKVGLFPVAIAVLHIFSS